MIVKIETKDRTSSPHPFPDGERAFGRDLAGEAHASRMAERVRGNEHQKEKDETCH